MNCFSHLREASPQLTRSVLSLNEIERMSIADPGSWCPQRHANSPRGWSRFRAGNAPARAAHRRCGGTFDYTNDLSNDGLRVWDANFGFWAMLLLSCTTAISGGMHGKEDQV